MSKRKSTAPYNSLQEIAYRRQQLKAQIRRQENILVKDMDAYEDDIETFKRLWSKVKGVRHLRQNISSSGIGQAVQAVRSFPIGKNAAKSGRRPGWLTAFAIGSEVANWILQRRRNKKK